MDFKKDEELALPDELRDKLEADAAFKAAWDALTPGRRRVAAGKGWNER